VLVAVPGHRFCRIQILVESFGLLHSDRPSEILDLTLSQVYQNDKVSLRLDLNSLQLCKSFILQSASGRALSVSDLRVNVEFDVNHWVGRFTSVTIYLVCTYQTMLPVSFEELPGGTFTQPASSAITS
jgi:hypothetical protein